MSGLQDQPIRPRFSVVLLGPRANAESVPKIHYSQLPTVPFSPPYLLHFPKFYHVTSLPLPRRFSDTAWEPSGQVHFLTPVHHFGAMPFAAPSHRPLFSLNSRVFSGLEVKYIHYMLMSENIT